MSASSQDSGQAAGSSQSAGGPTGDNYVYTAKDLADWAAKAGTAPLIAEQTYEVVANQQLVVHNIYIGNFVGVALLDTNTIAALHEPFQNPPPSPNIFEIQLAGEMGYGMFAARDIAAGELILVEHPSIVQPAVVKIQMTKNELCQLFFDRLPSSSRRALLNLSNCKPRELCTKEEGIIRTNGILVELPGSTRTSLSYVPHSGVFINASRCNHSCGPNATRYFDRKCFSLFVHALRPIPAGAEITLGCTPLPCSRAERRARLRQMYHYNCLCTYCELPDAAAIEASDNRRKELDEWDRGNIRFEHWVRDRSLPDDVLIRANLRALVMIEKEGLHDLSYGHLDNICRSYGALAEKEKFRFWGEKARLVWAAKGMKEVAEVYTRWLARPESFQQWAWRKPRNRR